MESDYWSQGLLFIVLLGLSAFFSGSETALFSLSELQRRKLKDDNSAAARRVLRLLSRPRALLTTILLGNTLVNVSAATIAALLTAEFAHVHHLSAFWTTFAEVVIVTLVILLFAEVTPKVIAVQHAESFSRRVSIFIELLYYLLYPLVEPLRLFSAWIERVLGVPESAEPLTEQELRALVDVGQEEGALLQDEREMIHSIFEFGRTHVREIMVPRIDMVCIERSASLSDLVNLIKEKGHTRIPIYEGTIDNIIGIIHAKDLLPYLVRENSDVDLAKLARPALFVPESKLIDELLREFQRERTHMAIVVDEYGGTAGLVTLEDVIEEIVGEIQDEYDREAPLYQKIDENTYVMDAKIDLDEVNEILGADLPTDEDFESLGGFIFDLTGYVPREGEKIVYGDFEFIVEKVQRNRILRVRVHRKQPAETETGKSS